MYAYPYSANPASFNAPSVPSYPSFPIAAPTSAGDAYYPPPVYNTAPYEQAPSSGGYSAPYAPGPRYGGAPYDKRKGIPEGVCSHFYKGFECRYGNECRFIHMAPNDIPQYPPQQQPQQVVYPSYTPYGGTGGGGVSGGGGGGVAYDDPGTGAGTGTMAYKRGRHSY